MPYKQGDLVWLIDPQTMPDGQKLPHPVLIISSNRANGYESYFTGVTMSATAHRDKFTFDCDNSMFEGTLAKDQCQIRLYITISFREADIKSLANRIKTVYLKAILDQMKEHVFCI